MTRILIALATLAALAAAQGPAPDPAAFTRDLAKAAKLVEGGGLSRGGWPGGLRSGTASGAQLHRSASQARRRARLLQ